MRIITLFYYLDDVSLNYKNNFFKKNIVYFFNLYNKLLNFYFKKTLNMYLGYAFFNCNIYFTQKKIKYITTESKFFQFFDGFFFPYTTHQDKSTRQFNINYQTLKLKKKIKKIKKYNVKLLTLFKKKINFSKKLINSIVKKPSKIKFIITRRKKRKIKRLRFKWLRHYRLSNIFSNYILKKTPFIWKKKIKNKNKTLTKTWCLIASRFKPGFLTEWRKNREAFNTIWNLNYSRQRRLTNFFLSLRGLCGFNFLRLLVLSVGQVCRLSFYTMSCRLNNNSIRNLYFIYKLNGCFIVNPFIQVYLGDCVQLIQSSIINNKINSPLSYKKYNFFYKKQNIFNVSFFFKLDSPCFLEIDELSLTSVLIMEPKIQQLLFFSEIGPLPFLSFRLYNWKYIT